MSPSPQPAPAPAGSSPAPAGQPVAVADDDADIRGLIAFALRRRGYHVLEAGDGTAALALIRTHRPALAVLDVTMPGLTGPQVAGALRADPLTAAIPVILVSADAPDPTSSGGPGRESGVAAFLQKPFSPQHLAARVAALLQ